MGAGLAQWICQTCRQPYEGTPRTPTLDPKLRLALCQTVWCPSRERDPGKRQATFRLIDSPSDSSAPSSEQRST